MKQRIYGVDLLRLISIFCVVVLHTLGRSGILGSSIQSQYAVAWLLETFAYFAVDCFGIISGFVNYSKEEKLLKISNLMDLWILVVFYGIVIILGFVVFTNNIVTRDYVITAIFPLLKGEYWFFSSYVGMFLFSNIVNNAIRNTDDRVLLSYSIVLLLFVSTLESISIRVNSSYSLFALDKGYNCFWLIIMYFVGATLRKTEIYKRFTDKKTTCLSIAAGMIFVSWLWQAFIGRCISNLISFGSHWERLLVEYISPTIICVSVLLVIVFSNLDLNIAFQRLLSVFAPSAFSVYLINSHPLIATYLYNKKNLQFITNYNGVKLCMTVIGISMLFVVISLFIDLMRAILFKRLGVSLKTKKIQNKLYHYFLN